MQQFLARKSFLLATLALLAALPCARAQSEQAASPGAPPGSSPPDSTSVHKAPRKIPLDGVANFGEVTPTLYRGAQPTRDGLTNLLRMGIEVVVDLREGERTEEREAVTKLGMKYVSIPWQCGHPDNEIAARFLALLQENPEKRVFVHCYYGTDRTGMMIAALRMAKENWTAAEAKKEMQAYGFSLTHRMMCPGLASYEEQFPGQFKTSPAFEKLRSPEHAPPAAAEPASTPAAPLPQP
jgi:tyrosine-protein phosphatase SIW14